MNKTLTILLITLANCCWGQNLVPNPSFEDTVACPQFVGDVSQAISWSTFATKGSNAADYFHSCAPTGLNVPNSFVGYQYAKTGEAMTGLVTYAWHQAPDGQNYREYVSAPLINTLSIGQKYYLSFFINFSGYLPNWQHIATNKLGMRFSTYQMNSNSVQPLDNFAHFYTDSIYSDTLNWLRVSGTFVADSNYAFIALGNFFDSTYTDSLIFGGPPFGGSAAYYFIDDVCVSPDSLTCYNFTSIQETNNNEEINIFPNPSNGFLTISSDKPIKNYKVYNAFGQLVSNGTLNTKSVQLNLSKNAKGIYYLVATTNNAAIRKKLIIQ